MRTFYVCLAFGSAVALAVACGSGDDVTFDGGPDGGNPGFDVTTGTDTGNPGTDTGLPPPDAGPPCSPTDTTVTGTVLDPAGKRSIYNAIVYIPKTTVDPIVNGASCDRCGTVSGQPVASAVTDAQGHFKMSVPLTAVGTNVPLVIQIGKWRRKLTIPITQCVENAQALGSLRLPRNGSEGDMPRIALASACDPMECSLRKFGIDDSEFSTGTGSGHVHIYRQNTTSVTAVGDAGTTAALTLWQSATELAKYDMLVNACECNAPADKTTAYAAVQKFVDSGGRLLTSHYGYDFLAPPRGPVAFQATANWMPGTAPNNASPYLIDTSVPKNKAFSDWVGWNVGGTAGQASMPNGLVRQDVGTVKLATQKRIYATQALDGGPESDKYITFNAPTIDPDGGADAGPVPASAQCGRVSFIDFHALYGNLYTGAPFPDVCQYFGVSLTDEEYLFEFVFFELDSCIQDETTAPVPPPATP